ncbi:MAG TPA: NAD(P)/FAD-dependent oxidoreductase [Acidimicrobiales bacterium]|nr:NAD(P)/FAD-dependent oxidoreductase [Acidimicrobiales bacterium]
MATTRSGPRDLSSLPHVIVLGGGFGGVATAKGLVGHDVRVTIIDQHNFHTFQPLLYQVATAGLEPADVAFPIRTIFGHAANVRFRHGRVRSVDQTRNLVTLGDDSRVSYDHLVIATGATAAFFGIPGASKFALPLYTLADARRLRNRLLSILEETEVRGESEQSSPELTFVVVGGGPTGVETSGALSELIQIAIRRDGLRLDPKRIHVVLVDVAPRLLTAFVARASEYAKRRLESTGVEVQFGRSVVAINENSIRFEDGEQIECAAVIWAAGVSAGDALPKDLRATSGPNGRLRVNPDLRLVGSDNVWAVGDAAAEPLGADFCPQLAPVAIQSGRHCAKQILHVVHGEATTPFHYHDKGIMATIGRNAAVAELPHGVVVKGRLGWLAWLGLHLWYLVGFRNRLRVLINWTWRYFDWPSGPRLIVADAETVD